MTYQPPTPQPGAQARRRTLWIGGGIAAALLVAVIVTVVVVVVLSSSPPSYAYRDDLCDVVDASPVLDILPASGAEQNGERQGDVGFQTCEFDLGTTLSTLRLTVEHFARGSHAEAQHEASVEFLETSDLVPHDPFDTVEEVTGPWRHGMIYVGDVFQSTDYTVRLKVQDDNVTLQVDLILETPEATTTYGADEVLPVAVRQVAENTLAAMAQ